MDISLEGRVNNIALPASKAFTTVLIESTYEQEDSLYERNLEFSFSNNGVKETSNHRINNSSKPIYTKIELQNFLPPFKKLGI